jgi:hypothetical protein
VERRKPLRADPDKARAWQERSRKPLDRAPMAKGRRSKRKKADDTALEAITPAVVARAGGMCEARIPGLCEGRGTNRHHRKDRSLGGTSTEANVRLLCGSGTSGCHGWITEHPEAASQYGWVLRSWEDPETVPWMRAPKLLFWRRTT